MLEEINHPEKAIDRTVDALQKENFEKLVTIFTEASQEIEDTLLELALQKNIDIAEGVWLDYIGALLGIPRQGESDELYRGKLKVQIVVNTSDGTPTVIQQAVKAFTDATSVRLIEGSKASFTLFVDFLMNGREELFDLVQEIKPVGVQAIVHTDYRDVDLTALDLVWEQNEFGDIYPPSINPDPEVNLLAWETDVTAFNAEAGEPFMEAGEPLAEAGEFSLNTTTDFQRPLRWEAYREITYDTDNTSLFCDVYAGYFYQNESGQDLWSTGNLIFNSSANQYEPSTDSLSFQMTTEPVWIDPDDGFGEGFQPSQLQINLSSSFVVDSGDYPFTCTVVVTCDNASSVVGSTVVNITAEDQDDGLFIDLDWSAQDANVNLQDISFTNSVVTEYPVVTCLSFT